MPVRYAVFLALHVRRRWVVRNRLVRRYDVVGAVRIGHDQRVFAVLVLEIVVNTLLFHQSADEVEVGFPVLRAVFPGSIGSAQRLFEVAEAVLPEDLLDDVRDGHFLKNTAVRCARQKPQPRSKHRLVSRVAAEPAGLAEFTAVAVEVTVATILDFDPNRHVLADDIVEVDRFGFAQEVEADFEQATEGLGCTHTPEQ